MTDALIPASFRDPSGFLFMHNRKLYRQVQPCYQPHYEQAQHSGLYQEFVREGLLISHREVSLENTSKNAYKILQPETIPFISYPYEWCFGQLKSAAELTLKIMRRALDKNMILKDAPASNIQFRGAKPVLIDSLSFEIYEEGKPWVAYQQFCRHFLAPLALMSQKDLRLNSLLMPYPDGIPLDMASRLLPLRSRFSPATALDIHLQAKLGLRASSAKNPGPRSMKKSDLRNLIRHLESAVESFHVPLQKTPWKSYPVSESYAPESFKSKQALVLKFLNKVSFKTLWDFGAHTGFFSDLAGAKADFVLALDGDPSAVEIHYQKLLKTPGKPILPLIMNLSQPSPALGWENKETLSLEDRGPADLILMLAFLHHLALSNNVPLPRIASWLARLSRYLIVEFIPKEDVKVQELLSRRKDIFEDYTKPGFEKAFAPYFKTIAQETLSGSFRTLYLLEKI